MRSRRRQHPNYKAYLSKQLRILQEKYPFLSSQQIKAKICSSWQRFSPKQKDEWGNAIGRRNLEKISGKENNSLDTSCNSEESSTSYESQTDDMNPYCVEYHKISTKQEKRVSFMEPISSPSENSLIQMDDNNTSKLWPGLNDFNAIMEHKLDIEQGVPQDNDEMKQHQDSWPLFSDLSTIFSPKFHDNELDKKIDEETDEEQDNSEGRDGLMCSLFENIQPKFRSTVDARLLSCLDKSKDIRVVRLFEEDDKFFA